MQNQQRYFRIGLITVFTALLLTGMIFFLGVADEFAPKIHFVTSFSESVQGLTKGAAVKYKGVPIGEVANISILPMEKIIRVDMNIDPDVFVGMPGNDNAGERTKQIIKFCEQGRAAGLCCRLELAGITGLRYIEIDYLPQARHRSQPLPVIDEPEITYLPSVPSTFNNMIDSVASSLDKIAKINLDQIVSGVNDNLTALNKILNNPDILQTISQLRSASENIEKISCNISENVTGEELKRFVNTVNDNLSNLNELTGNMQQKLNQINAVQINEQLTGILYESRKFLTELRENRSDIMYTLQKLSGLMDSFSEFVEYLKKDPSSLIRGKSAPAVELKAQ